MSVTTVIPIGEYELFKRPSVSVLAPAKAKVSINKLGVVSFNRDAKLLAVLPTNDDGSNKEWFVQLRKAPALGGFLMIVTEDAKTEGAMPLRLSARGNPELRCRPIIGWLGMDEPCVARLFPIRKIDAADDHGIIKRCFLVAFDFTAEGSIDG